MNESLIHYTRGGGEMGAEASASFAVEKEHSTANKKLKPNRSTLFMWHTR